jgi:hypothetical protein
MNSYCLLPCATWIQSKPSYPISLRFISKLYSYSQPRLDLPSRPQTISEYQPPSSVETSPLTPHLPTPITKQQSTCFGVRYDPHVAVSNFHVFYAVCILKVVHWHQYFVGAHPDIAFPERWHEELVQKTVLFAVRVSMYILLRHGCRSAKYTSLLDATCLRDC